MIPSMLEEYLLSISVRNRLRNYGKVLINCVKVNDKNRVNKHKMRK